jgi:hypothetical protein
MHIRLAAMLAAASVCVLVPALAGAVLDPAVKCHAAKLKLSGKYAACRLLEDAAATKAGTMPDYTTCDERFQAGWAKVEASLGSECPTLGDLPDVKDSLVECTTSPRWLIRFSVTSTHAMGAIQFEVDYALANGEFPGTGNSVNCQPSIPGALFADTDYDASETLTIGLIEQDGFTTPREIARCIFESGDGSAPLPSQFALSIDDAVDTSGNPVPGVTLSVSIDVAP